MRDNADLSQVGLNVLTEFVIGYVQPGKPVAMM